MFGIAFLEGKWAGIAELVTSDSLIAFLRSDANIYLTVIFKREINFGPKSGNHLTFNGHIQLFYGGNS